MKRTADHWMELLGLISHPEGGYFKETYRSGQVVSLPALGGNDAGDRHAGTAIYFLVTADQPSCFHRLGTDEVWHHYDGDTLEILQIQPDGSTLSTHLGKDGPPGTLPQQLVRAGTWFAARVVPGGKYSLCGCTMAPGFDFSDFELGSRKRLAAAYPLLVDLIQALTKQE
ncbi:MAG: hypothetical protein RLZZ165_1260 [Bacteroidota bacterium]